jgi:hypothetical protein
MEKFTKVRNDFLERQDLTPDEKLILIYLHGRMRKGGRAWDIQRSQLQEALGLGQYTVRKALQHLRELGWITDNTKPYRDSSGRMRRAPATVVAGRKPEVVVPDRQVSPGRTEGWNPAVGNQPSAAADNVGPFTARSGDPRRPA